MRSLIKSSMLYGMAEIFLLCVAIVRNKILAVGIGPVGFGIYGLLASFFGFGSIFVGAWIATGTTVFVAEHSSTGDTKRRDELFTFACVITVCIGTGIALVLVAGRTYFIGHFLSVEVLPTYYLLFAASFIGANLLLVLNATLQGVLNVKVVVRSRTIIALLDILFVVLLVQMLNILGFFTALLVSSVLAPIVTLYFLVRRCGLRFRRVSWRGDVVRRMMSFGGVNFFLAILGLGSLFLQRLILVRAHGIESVGIFQAGSAIMAYVGLFNKGTDYHLFPTMSQRMDNVVRTAKVNEYLLLCLLVTIPAAVAFILYGPHVIRVLYSAKFLPLASYLFWFVIAQAAILVASPLQMTVVGMKRLRVHTAASVVIHSLWVIVPVLLIDRLGIAALPIGMLIGSVAGGMIYFGFLRTTIGLTLTARVASLGIAAVVAISVAVVCRGLPIAAQLVVMVAVIAAMAAFLTKEERFKVLQSTRSTLRFAR